MEQICVFNQGVVGDEGYCFRMAVKWAGLVIAGKDPKAAAYLNRVQPRNWDKTRAKQAQYAAAAEADAELEESLGLPEVQRQWAHDWLQRIAGKQSPGQPAPVATTLVDFETEAFETYQDSKGCGDVVRWAGADVKSLVGWRALVMTCDSETHTVAVARPPGSGTTIYAFDPNLGVWQTDAGQGDALAQFIDKMRAGNGTQFFADSVVVVG